MTDLPKRRPGDVTLRPRVELIDATAWVAPGATVVGAVHLGPESSVWFGAVLRGDTEPIQIGARSNVQDGAVLHADPGHPCIIGQRVTIGHRAVVHGATVGDDAVIGIGAIVLTGAAIGGGAIVAAGAVVREGMVVAAGTLVAGCPAVVKGDVRPDHRDRMIEGNEHYVTLSRRYLALMPMAPMSPAP